MLSISAKHRIKFGSAKKLSDKKLHPARPRTKGTQEELKKVGGILGFTSLPQGALPKATAQKDPVAQSKHLERRGKYHC